MRVVALEEHYTVPGIVSRIDPAAIRRRGFHQERLSPPTLGILGSTQSHNSSMSGAGGPAVMFREQSL